MTVLREIIAKFCRNIECLKGISVNHSIEININIQKPST